MAKLLSTEHVDLVRESLRWVVQQMMEAEVTDLIDGDMNVLGGTPPPRAMKNSTA